DWSSDVCSSDLSRECSLWFGDTDLSSCHLGGIAGDKVEHCLCLGQIRYRRKDTKSITRQEKYIFWQSPKRRLLRVRNIIDRVGYARIFRKTGIAKINNITICKERNIL